MENQLANENEIKMESLPTKPWNENIKEVVTNSSYQIMIDNRELQIEAKKGNEEAAVELVEKLVNKEVVNNLAKKYPNAIVIPVPSIETADKKPNAIPLTYALEFEDLGLDVLKENEIIEIDSVHHTGKSSFKRAVNRPHFEGVVQEGKEYIIVDDVFTMGGTINSLRSYIENKGGKVVAVSTLTAGVENSKIIAITDDTLNELVNSDGKGDLLNAIRKLDIAENFEALTEPIGRYISRNREKILNEERTRRAKTHSKRNDEQTQTIEKKQRINQPINQDNNLNTKSNISPTEYLTQKINASGINIHLSKEEMKAILEAGENVQKLAVKYGTNQNIESENENSFNGYGTYVVSVNEENARQLGIKIASRKYGGTFYINNQPLNDFLQEKNFSPYWLKRLEQFNSNSVDNLAHEILMANVGGNPTLEKEQTALTTLLSLDLVEYKREQTYLYSVEIPDNDNTNYFLYNNPIGLEQATKINNELEKMGVEWRASRNDIGKNIYFELLSKKVFEGNQKLASEFLKENVGFVGMQMDNANYIIFNDKDMSINNRVQYMKSENGEVYGFTFDGEIYIDEDLVNSNVLAHEYTHIWDNYVQKNNPDLWQKGMTCLKGTSLWYEITEDKNYENLRTDDEILSECHARIVGKMAEQVLERIAARDGEFTKDKIIDWDREVSDYVTTELLIKPELGEENYISESVKAEYLKEFLSMPMKDLMNELKVQMEKGQEKNYSSILKIHNILKEEEIRGLEVVSQEDFNKIVDALYHEPKPDYKNIPNIIRLPNINENLSKEIGIENVSFFLKTNIAHVRPQRKSEYNQDLRIEEMKGMLDFIKNCETAYIDMKKGNFFLAGLDEQNNSKVNKVVFEKDLNGNYIVTIGKIDAVQIEAKKYNKVAVGVAPTIWRPLKEEALSTVLTPSTTLQNEQNVHTINIIDSDNLSSGTQKSSKIQKYAETIDNPQTENPEESVEKSSQVSDIQQEETVVSEKKELSEKEKEHKIIFGQTKIPEVAMITQHGLQTYKNLTIEGYKETEKSYLLRSEDGKSISVTENTLKELTSEKQQEKAQKFDENTKATEKMLETQYNDFFETRKNTANNFRHNLSVLCRKEANSPLDALKIASSIISQMPKEEKAKTKDLLNLLRKDGQTVNEVLIETYHEAVKDVPLNEDYLKNKRYDNIIARPMYDTISNKGQKLDKDFNLKIGDSVQVTFKVDKAAGTKFSLKKENLFQECTIISSSKEANKVTLMDGNKSFYDVPRDTFLQEYAKREKIEHKQEQKNQRSRSMEIEIGR